MMEIETNTSEHNNTMSLNKQYTTKIVDEELKETLEDLTTFETQHFTRHGFNKLPARIKVGNTARWVPEKEMFAWKIVVKEESSNESLRKDFIKQVTYHLHPTFSPSTLTVSRQSHENEFVLSRLGWGTFTIDIDIEDVYGGKHFLQHELSFCNDEQGIQPNRNHNVFHSKTIFLSKAPETDACAERLMQGVPSREMHGKIGASRFPTWRAPRMVVQCDEDNRPGYTSRKSHEYVEHPNVLRAKVKLLAELLKKSKNAITYTGAGISTASGIGDYASKAKNSLINKGKHVKPKLRNWLAAEPTLGHRVLASLIKANTVKHWVQQNHDGLPQKAGVPQEKINEIHGAWFDPSNPVVPMTGSLRGDLMDMLLLWEEKADLVLAMGSSLCGMNADRVVTTAGEKFARGDGSSYGPVIVSLQKTQYDDLSSLRIFAKIDDVMALLAKEMKLQVKPYEAVNQLHTNSSHKFRVPYDKHGNLLSSKSSSEGIVWNLQPGAKVVVTNGPGKGFRGTVLGINADGHYRVSLPCQREGSKDHGKGSRIYVLGKWWVTTARKGAWPQLPIVNV